MTDTLSWDRVPGRSIPSPLACRIAAAVQDAELSAGLTEVGTAHLRAARIIDAEVGPVVAALRSLLAPAVFGAVHGPGEPQVRAVYFVDAWEAARAALRTIDGAW